MPRPRRSTRDAWLDEFADFDIETQESLLDLCELIHKQAKRRPKKEPAADVPAKPDESGYAARLVDLDTLLDQRQAVLISGERKQ